MLRKFRVRRRCLVPRPLTCPSAKKSDCTGMFVTTGSVDGRSVLPETQFVCTRLRIDTTRALSVENSLPPMGAAEERPEVDVKPPYGDPLMSFTRGYLLKYFPEGDTSASQWEFEIRGCALLSELPMAIEPHLPVCQLFRWQLYSNTWSSPTTKSFDSMVVTAVRVDFPWYGLEPATGGFACNCPVQEA